MATGIDEARGLFIEYFDHFGHAYQVDDDGDLSWRATVPVDGVAKAITCDGTVCFSGPFGDVLRAEVYFGPSSTFPPERYWETLDLATRANWDLNKEVAFRVCSDPMAMMATSGVVTDVLSLKTVQSLCDIPQTTIRRILPHAISVWRGERTGAEAAAAFLAASKQAT